MPVQFRVLDESHLFWAQVLARGLAARLPSPPIELALVEASAHLLQHHTSPDRPAHAPDAAAECLPAAVLSFLRQRVRSARGCGPHLIGI